MRKTLLGNISPEEFLRDYWQKKPLLIRQAWTDFPELIDFVRLAELAARDDVESRLIEYKNQSWKLENGPFSSARLKRLGETDWTILVQNVNHLVPHISDLLYRFNFLPYTRLDDLMISYAPPGGTVGPHYDSYDVFLLQVGGQKRWQISSDDASGFIEDAPIRVLKDFNPEQEWVLEHGDMLYLPPKYAHYGVALEPGMTYSIGFRAPKTQEIASKFLEYLQDELCLDGIYADPDATVTNTPAQIDQQFATRIGDMLKKVTWNEKTITDFIGRYFSEPKPHVFFDQTEELLGYDEFAATVCAHGIMLDLKSQMLYSDDCIYINGEVIETEPDTFAALHELANRRQLDAGEYDDSLLETLFTYYEYGYLIPIVPKSAD
ncbi:MULTISPECIES: cupin domain-containing protein [Deefgea]|uniref:Cupin domain-containing protein n=1 Tax=Deefgea chitinilytica TaxID=570276 RepID=A0ABS2CCK5_9NEIS|nr:MULTISPECIES: cupin domain-containing protein [Deefgea]MBM5571086.1 cupin domain-containing protein [Deefgea chitinilytica]MBM9888316.1 cupin domain-containing protein [Deefgea sp. CFH1-16]